MGPTRAGASTVRARARLFALVNDYRRDHGMSALHERQRVDRVAQNHSLAMATQRTLYHTSGLWTKLRAYHPATWGENVGMGPSARSVFTAWRRSSPHRTNMLYRRFHSAGVGVVSSHGILWVTMIFYG